MGDNPYMVRPQTGKTRIFSFSRHLASCHWPCGPRSRSVSIQPTTPADLLNRDLDLVPRQRNLQVLQARVAHRSAG